jgi:hypothetical protein
LPVRFDKLVDYELPRRMICFRPTTGPFEIRREMRPDERAAAEARAAALEIALLPHGDSARSEIEAAIAGMLSGFRSMRQGEDDAATAVAITRAVLREFPAWAILQGCLKIARRETRCDPRFAPNDAEIVEVVRSIVKPYREAFDAASALLVAVVQDARPVAAVPRELPKIGDGKHGERVAADLERRKAERASP